MKRFLGKFLPSAVFYQDISSGAGRLRIPQTVLGRAPNQWLGRQARASTFSFENQTKPLTNVRPTAAFPRPLTQATPVQGELRLLQPVPLVFPAARPRARPSENYALCRWRLPPASCYQGTRLYGAVSLRRGRWRCHGAVTIFLRAICLVIWDLAHDYWDTPKPSAQLQPRRRLVRRGTAGDFPIAPGAAHERKSSP